MFRLWLPPSPGGVSSAMKNFISDQDTVGLTGRQLAAGVADRRLSFDRKGMRESAVYVRYYTTASRCIATSDWGTEAGNMTRLFMKKTTGRTQWEAKVNARESGKRLEAVPWCRRFRV